MKGPAELAAERIMARLSGYMVPADARESSLREEQLIKEIQEVIGEEFEGHLKEDHHGPKQGTYMRRALEND